MRLCRGLFASLGTRFDGIEHLQQESERRVEHWSERTICPATGKTVRASWEAEQRYLRPLPILPEPFDVAVLRTVGRDALVHFEQRQYAVPFHYALRQVEVRGCATTVQIVADHKVLREYPRRTEQRILLGEGCYEGVSTANVLAPPPLGRMGKRLAEICAMPVEKRPIDLYAALAEVAR